METKRVEILIAADVKYLGLRRIGHLFQVTVGEISVPERFLESAKSRLYIAGRGMLGRIGVNLIAGDDNYIEIVGDGRFVIATGE